MKRILFIVLLMAVCLSVGPSIAGNDSKVTICHYPPGNPDNPQTITVGAKALQAHLAHGDTLGPCPSGCLLDENLCDDGDACTNDICLPTGECAHNPVDCDDGNICTEDICAPAEGCVYTSIDGIPCDDGNACTDPDTCQSTFCVGQQVVGCCLSDLDCDDGDNCTVDTCSGDNTCSNVPVDCTVADKCLVGFCDPSSGLCDTTPTNCDDSNDCTDDFCHSDTGCYSVAICEGSDNSCGCTACVDCSASDGWYNVGGTYACCDGTSACAICQDQEFRNFSCSGTECTYAVTDTQTLKGDCTSCGDGDTCDNGGCVSSFTYFTTCGDPTCVGYTDKGLPLCTTEQEGHSCDTEGTVCQIENDFCNTNIICAAEDPKGSGCPISRARYKKDIRYLNSNERAIYAQELLNFKLATYRYKADGDGGRMNLGFIIEDVEPSVAVYADLDRVDLYGFTSMAVAALQEQQATINALQRELEILKAALEALTRKKK